MKTIKNNTDGLKYGRVMQFRKFNKQLQLLGHTTETLTDKTNSAVSLAESKITNEVH